ncbi:hypothetical protein [Sphingomonas limnosediminicola]
MPAALIIVVVLVAGLVLYSTWNDRRLLHRSDERARKDDLNSPN